LKKKQKNDEQNSLRNTEVLVQNIVARFYRSRCSMVILSCVARHLRCNKGL